MASLLKAGRLLSYSAVTVFSALSITVSPVFAATAQTSTAEPNLVLRYEPICSDAASAQSFWKVSNDNQTAIDFDWNNVENAKDGTTTALVGQTIFATDFVAGDPNNRTEFTTVMPADHVSRNAQVAPCGDLPDVTPLCVDGTMHDNLYVEITSDNLALVETKSGLPVCDDVELFYSAYIMPGNYDGQGFFLNGDVNTPNETAFPQTLSGESDSVVMEAGKHNVAIMSVELPDSCNNVQLDVYYGPEITTVGPTGHGTQNLLSKILQSTGTCHVEPGQGGGGETPVTPPVVTPPVVTPPVVTPPVTEAPGMGGGETTPVVAVSAQPAQLANTGSDTSLPYLVALTILLATSAVVLTGRKASRA